jgi:hypothetical protein
MLQLLVGQDNFSPLMPEAKGCAGFDGQLITGKVC